MMGIGELAIVLAVVLGGLLCTGLAVLLGAVMVRSSVKREGRMGVNLTPGRCPSCGEALPSLRRPRTLNQVLWGGWTCEGCGAELDKWGRPR